MLSVDHVIVMPVLLAGVADKPDGATGKTVELFVTVCAVNAIIALGVAALSVMFPGI